jgi:hypothetical protein
MLVSVNDFIIEINIPNTDETAVIENLQGFINKYEPRYLTQLLGDALYTDFKAGLVIEPIPAKWQSLKDNISIEQIASFVFFYYIRSKNSYNSGLNVIVKPKSENATAISPIITQVDVWNDMVDASYTSAKYIQDNNSLYGNYYLPTVCHMFYYGYNRMCLPDIFEKLNYQNR